MVFLLGLPFDEPVGIHAAYWDRRHLAPKVTGLRQLIEKFTPSPWEY